eukprot:3433733-Alexandrium_andersonii.AAC.1
MRTLRKKSSGESDAFHCCWSAELGRSAATRRRLFIRDGTLRCSTGVSGTRRMISLTLSRV